MATSKRIWSLPARVEPWATAVGADLARHRDDRLGLGRALGADADGVGAAAQAVALDQVGDEAVEDHRPGVDDAVIRDAERPCPGRDGLAAPRR